AALELVRESAEPAREAGVPWWESGALGELACLSLNAGRVDECETHARQSLEIADQLRDRAGRVFGVGLLAVTAAERGMEERAGLLWGAVEDEDGFAPLGGWRRHREACQHRVLQLAAPTFERSRIVGRALTLDD